MLEMWVLLSVQGVLFSGLEWTGRCGHRDTFCSFRTTDVETYTDEMR